MSLHAPFLIKQYLSNDVESGSYSRIFWYYPLDKEVSTQGGIGLFFEVISGDVTDEVYEQVAKRFWESFKDSFYVDGFEQALKKSIKMFIQLLKNFGVEEGIDVNIALLNVVESVKGYTLKLISFGDSDIFVVREGKFADMSKMVPVNQTMYDLKFLEVELDNGDVLMLGNKTLLRNAFENDMLALTGIEDLLKSLEDFKENLFGSSKLFLIAATELEAPVQKQKVKAQEYLKKAAVTAGALVSKSKDFITGILSKIKKDKVSSVAETVLSPNDNPPIWSTKDTEEDMVELPTENEPETEMETFQQEEKEEIVVENEPEEKSEEEDSGYVAPPPIVYSAEVSEELTDIDEEKPTEDEHIVEPVTVLPGKDVSVEDFVVAEEITTSMVMEKSDYKEVVNSAMEGVEENLEPVEVIGNKRYVEAPTLPTKGKDFVNELRSRHSVLGKITRNPLIKSITQSIKGIFSAIYAKILSLLGKDPVISDRKLFLTRPTSLEKSRKIQPGVIIILVIIILGVFFWAKGSITRSKLEKKLLADYQQQVSLFSTFYERNIAVIDTEDTEKQLELCAPEADKVYAKEKEVLTKIKTEKTILSVNALTSQVQSKAAECRTKFDKIYGITRVKDAELVTDFKVSLGNDSDISAISLRSGAIVVADKGRKAVYQINVETKAIIKLEDPLGLVVDPLTVGTGENTLFVCDKTNGILYYSKQATGSNEGFNRVVGAEPSSIGECAYVDGYAQNAYIVPSTANVLYKIVAKKGGGFDAPVRYIQNLTGVKSLSIDGHIYIVSSVNGKGEIARYLGGKLDNFTIPQSANLGDLISSYTNPSAERNLYVYDKTQNAVLSIEKPNSKHPGKGVIEKTYQFENNDKFKDVKSIAIDLSIRNQEVNMYVLAGTTIWKVKL